MADDQDLAEVTFACVWRRKLTNILTQQVTGPPLTCVVEKTPWRKVNKYPHPSRIWGADHRKEIKHSTSPPNMFGGEDLMDESKQPASLK